MYETPGSQFLRATTLLWSGAGALKESGSHITFLIILGVTRILQGFKLVLEGEPGYYSHEKLEFVEKISGKNFALSDAEDKE